MHRIRVQSALPPIRVKKAVVKLCYVAQLCLCPLPTLRHYVDSLKGYLRKHVAKDTPARPILEQNALVITLGGATDTEVFSDFWHISYENKTTWNSCVSALDEDVDIWRVRRAQALNQTPLLLDEGRPHCGGLNWWQALKDTHFQVPRTIEFFELSTLDQEVVDLEPKFVAFHRFSPAHVQEFWPGPEEFYKRAQQAKVDKSAKAAKDSQGEQKTQT